MRFAQLLLICGLGACAEFPSIDTPLAVDTGFPQLTPLAPILAQAAQQGQIVQTTPDLLGGRIAALNTRAARLRGPVIAAPTLTRMRRGVAVGPLR